MMPITCCFFVFFFTFNNKCWENIQILYFGDTWVNSYFNVILTLHTAALWAYICCLDVGTSSPATYCPQHPGDAYGHVSAGTERRGDVDQKHSRLSGSLPVSTRRCLYSIDCQAPPNPRQRSCFSCQPAKLQLSCHEMDGNKDASSVSCRRLPQLKRGSRAWADMWTRCAA